MDINSILTQATPFIEWTFDKPMDIYGEEHYTKPNGADGVRFAIVEENIPCRISVVKLSNTDQEQANKLSETLKLFCGAQVSLPAGSKLIVSGVSYETTEEPMKYATHQEVYIHRKAWV